MESCGKQYKCWTKHLRMFKVATLCLGWQLCTLLEFFQPVSWGMPFTEEWLPSGHSTVTAWLVECCRDTCPNRRCSHLHRGTLELCQRDHQVLGDLPDQCPSQRIAQFWRAVRSRKSLPGSKLLPFKNDGGQCVLGDLQCYRHFLVSLPRSVLKTILSRALQKIPSNSWLGFCSDMHCQLWDLI